MPRPMITMTRNRLVYHDRQHLPRYLFIVWLASYIILICATALLWYDLSVLGQEIRHWERVLSSAILAMLVWTVFPLVFFGGFKVNPETKTAWRLRLPLLPVKRFSIEGADALGITDRIKLYRAADGGIDKVHNYTLFFRYWDGGVRQLYDTQKRDRAVQLQKELADYLFLQELPVTEEDIPGRKAV